MGKGEISWKRQTPDGERVEVYAHHSGRHWRFYARQRRYQRWEPLADPPLEDWIELLDGVRRRIRRRLLRPEEETRVKQLAAECFPDAELE